MSWRACGPGESLASEGSATQDRACAPCPKGTFTSTPDQTACEPCADGRCEDMCAATFGVTCDQFALDALSPRDDQGSAFGSVVALDGDTLIVSAPRDDNPVAGITPKAEDAEAPLKRIQRGAKQQKPQPPRTLSGAVYVFVRDAKAGGWRQQAYLKASHPDANDLFGARVAIQGDTLAVGAHMESSAATGVNGDARDNSAPRSGAVYLFTRDKRGGWRQRAYLKASQSRAGDMFGNALALTDDTLAIGASRGLGSESGVVYLFKRDKKGAWQQEAALRADTPQDGDGFGVDLAMPHGELLAVGAPYAPSATRSADGATHDAALIRSGAVHLFALRDGQWQHQAKLKAPTPRAQDLFGARLTMTDDTLAVSALGESSGAQGAPAAPESGAVYVFARGDGEAWAHQATLKTARPGPGDQFGAALAMRDDLLFVGAPYESIAATGINGAPLAGQEAPMSGAVYLFKRREGAWRQHAYIKSQATYAGESFGRALAMSPSTLFIGASALTEPVPGPKPGTTRAEDRGTVHLRRIAP